MQRRKSTTYKGWKVTFDRYRPTTGTWRAERYEVGLSHNSLESIKLMIDAKILQCPELGSHNIALA